MEKKTTTGRIAYQRYTSYFLFPAVHVASRNYGNQIPRWLTHNDQADTAAIGLAPYERQ